MWSPSGWSNRSPRSPTARPATSAVVRSRPRQPWSPLQRDDLPAADDLDREGSVLGEGADGLAHVVEGGDGGVVYLRDDVVDSEADLVGVAAGADGEDDGALAGRERELRGDRGVDGREAEAERARLRLHRVVVVA